jgi:hypothetical protein
VALLENALEGKKPRRAPARRSHPGQGGDRRVNGLPRGAKLRSGRAGRLPASPTCSSRGARGNASSFNGSGNRRPGPCVRRASGRAVAKGRLGGESPGKARGTSRLAAVEREPTRKHRPARAGTAPREGKALKGDSRDASGMEQGREASGRHGNRRAPRGARTIRDRSQNRREGQEP